MRSIHQVIPVGGGEGEGDSRVQEESTGGRDVGEGEGQRFEDDDEESRVAEDMSGGNGRGDTSHLICTQKQVPPPPPAPPPPQQLPPGFAVHWERFLPVRSLKVLLVENDDCTRQVVSALLRNCSYEVIATTNGLEAWKILADLTRHVDLVLSEVVMPGLSGIGLLCKIMSHKTCKNIPVIMMSSQDSMGIVFKCLSMGAVDFLVKPIRKNELKNLWQHVWRRCHSSSGSGSGSESGIQTQKSVKSRCAETDNNIGSSNEDNDASNGLDMRDGSDNGSGTQSSWTQRDAEIESPQTMSPSNDLADPPNSTFAQAIHSKTGMFCGQWTLLGGSKVCQEKPIVENESVEKDVEMGIPTDLDIQPGSYPGGTVPPTSVRSLMEAPENVSKKNKASKKNLMEIDSAKAKIKSIKEVTDLPGAIFKTNNSKTTANAAGTLSDAHVISESNDKARSKPGDFPSLELSLKRPASTRDGGTAINDDRSILKHSDVSAFCRYNTSAASNHIPTEFGGDGSFPIDNRSEVVNMSKYIPLNQGSNGSSNNNDMESTAKNGFTKPATYVEKSAPISAVKPGHSSAFHPVQQRSTATNEVLKEKIEDLTTDATVNQPKDIHQQVQVRHHHHHYHHHHVHNIQQQSQLQHPSDQDEFTRKIMSSAVTQCGSCNVYSGPVEYNAANYSVNGSVSGSNHGSNAHNGSGAAENTGGINVDLDSAVVAKGGGLDGNGSGSGSRVDEYRVARREAALNKFRQKRKERCFEKKVRYQSRKKLAEQRPRVRGQFVRQTVGEQKERDVDS